MKKNLIITLILSSLLILSGCSGPEEPSSSSSESSEIIEDTFTITLDTGDGPKYNDIVAKKDSVVTIPTPEYYHHDFLGWYDNNSYEGEIIPQNDFVVTKNQTLYAKWDEVLYVYMYYGTSTDHKRFSVHPGETFNLLDSFTPDSIMIEGVECPFVKWTYDYTKEDAPDSIVIGDEDLFFTAVYDKSNIPPKKYLVDIGDGQYESTGRVVWPFFDGGDSNRGIIECDITVPKGASGGSGLTCMLEPGKVDYPFEVGQSYFAIVFIPASGKLQASYVLPNESWKSYAVVEFASLSKETQERFNNTSNSQDFTFHFSLICTGNTIEVYMDHYLIYVASDLSTFASCTGTKFGIRATTMGTIFSNFSFNAEPKNIHLDFLGLADNRDYLYYGELIPTSGYETINYTISSWAFDKEGLDIFDYSKANRIVDGITLYASGRKLYRFDGLNDLGNNTYTTKANSANAGLIGVSEDNNITINMDVKVVKGKGGAVGAIIHAGISADNIWEKSGAEYLIAQIGNDGKIYAAKVNSKDSTPYGHINNFVGSKALVDMPDSFKNPYNNATAGEIIEANLKVVSTDTSYSIYVNDKLMLTTNDPTLIGSYTHTGYGVRINSGCAGQEFTYTVSKNA